MFSDNLQDSSIMAILRRQQNQGQNMFRVNDGSSTVTTVRNPLGFDSQVSTYADGSSSEPCYSLKLW